MPVRIVRRVATAAFAVLGVVALASARDAPREAGMAEAGYRVEGDLYERILAALRRGEKALDALTLEDLAPVDHFHARGLPATVELADHLRTSERSHLVDIGCGLGGPARYMARRFKCQVSGVDITAEFVRTGRQLNALLGMDDRVHLEEGDALRLPYADMSFDGGYSQHVTMNIPDRERFFAEAARVLKPGACFALTEHGLGPKGEPLYPVPWSADGAHSYLVTPEATRRFAFDAGFEAIEMVDMSEKYLAGYRKSLERAPEDVPALGVHLFLGPDARERSANAMRNLEEGRTRAFQMWCRKRNR
jgi:ubiquinone/menaquinone biosynthesis C-methylase UbiE